MPVERELLRIRQCRLLRIGKRTRFEIEKLLQFRLRRSVPRSLRGV